jgi:FAD/FMN-containing dehydrogenase
MVLQEIGRAQGIGAGALDRLAERLAGDLIRPGDAEYEMSRKVWNRSVDRYPAAIVRSRDAADVAETVRFARRHDLPLAVRSGGHSMAGHGVVDKGLVLDVSGMKGMSVDPERRIAWAQPGLTWGEYANRAGVYGLATPAGDSGSVGLSGLTLGGGIGFLVRKYGLTVDSLLSAEIVTADGRLLTASETEHPDLFWALRGGGGNFGVVTGLEFRLHPVNTIYGGAIIHEATAETLQGYARAAAAAPEALSTIAFVLQAPPLPFIPAEKHGSLVLMTLVCYDGEAAAGEAAVAPLRAIAPTVSEMLAPMPYPALFQLTAGGATSRHHSVRTGYMAALDASAAETIMTHAGRMSSPFGAVQLRALGGAMARVPSDATAFAHRDKALMLTLINAWDDAAEAPRHVAWTEAFWRDIQPRTSGAYVNFLEDEGRDRIREAYPTLTRQRLAAIKGRYDPENLFRGNQNIRPA